MRIGILGQPKGWHARQLREAATHRGHQALAIDYRSLVADLSEQRNSLIADGVDLLSLDRVIVRSIPAGSLEQVVVRVDAIHRLEAEGIPVLNPARAIEACVDKYLAAARLKSANLLLPRTIVCETASAALAAFEGLRRDVVVKPVFGAEGRGILRISDPAMAQRCFRTLEQLAAVALVQEFIPNEGCDIRIFVLASRVVAAMKRWSAPHDFRANVTQGGRAETYHPSSEEEAMALAAAKAVHAPMAGVDLLRARDGRLYLLEVNSSPGFQALSRVTGVDVADRIIEAVEEAQ